MIGYWAPKFLSFTSHNKIWNLMKSILAKQNWNTKRWKKYLNFWYLEQLHSHHPQQKQQQQPQISQKNRNHSFQTKVNGKERKLFLNLFHDKRYWAIIVRLTVILHTRYLEQCSYKTLLVIKRNFPICAFFAVVTLLKKMFLF